MSDDVPLSPDEIAKTVAQTMFLKDRASQELGMALKEIRAGFAVMTMRVTENMLNGHKICHGGYIFTFADSTFAFACNSYNQNNVAQSAQINFLKGVPLDTLLTATAEEQNRTGRTGLYDIRVHDEDNTTVALFRGNSHTIKGQIIPGLTGEK